MRLDLLTALVMLLEFTAYVFVAMPRQKALGNNTTQQLTFDDNLAKHILYILGQQMMPERIKLHTLALSVS